MYFSINDKSLFPECFEHWDNGPVVREVYKAHRYENLAKAENLDVVVSDPCALQVLHIINMVYGDLGSKEIADESHRSKLWQETSRNQIINFENISPEERNFMRSLYDIYKDLDFETLGVEEINGNKYFYDKSNLEMTDDLVEELERIGPLLEPAFIEIIDGELVFS